VRQTTHDALIVGAGMAGLTAAAFLAREGRSVLLCEKEARCGGLVGSFRRDGFVFDSGIRALENSGILFPMLRRLGIDMEFFRSTVSLGVEDTVMRLPDSGSVEAYEKFLLGLFPESAADVGRIVADIRRFMGYLDVLYGIDNPMFLDMRKDRDYVTRKILPWVVRYLFTAPKIARLQGPVDEYLERRTSNRVLRDMIAQHFFAKTPTFFAMSYLSLYLDYHYPRGGVGAVPERLVSFITSRGGQIRNLVEVVEVDPVSRTATDSAGAVHPYRELIWAADVNRLYRAVDSPGALGPRVRDAVAGARRELAGKRGGDSVLMVYAAVDLPPEHFASICTGHFFYTPRKTGLSSMPPAPPVSSRTGMERWLEDFFALTTYEISIPVLRDASLAPEGKTGLVISTLFDYHIARTAREMGWYAEFKELCGALTIRNLDASIYPGIEERLLFSVCATPLSVARIAGTTDGAITGWAFTNSKIPAERTMTRIVGAVSTPIPHVSQAGQWTFTPAGFPIAILTGKVAADRAIRALRRHR
jgi:phytoene dehydrogenase-like protein